MKPCIAALFILLASIALTSTAQACVETGDVMHPVCGMGRPLAAPTIAHVRTAVRHAWHQVSEIVAHPAGCPRVEFCGCGAAVHIFGRPVRSLWLAANWFKFPHARVPRPGMAAVRRHHVFVLEADLGGGVWRVYDANSGHHLTRVHARSIAGYTIVDPRGA